MSIVGATLVSETPTESIEQQISRRIAEEEAEKAARDEYRNAVAQDLALHHRMLYELHARLSKLEQMQPNIVTEVPRDIDPKFLRP